MRSRQLKFVFAASPPGGGKSGPSDASGGRDFLLHTASRRTANDLGARAADASQSHWPLDGHDRPSPETGTQRAGCVTHKSGSERGLGAKAPGPTRQRPATGMGSPSPRKRLRIKCDAYPTALATLDQAPSSQTA